MNSRWVWKYRALTGLKNCGVTNSSSHHSRGSIWGGPRFSSPVVLVTSGRDSQSQQVLVPQMVASLLGELTDQVSGHVHSTEPGFCDNISEVIPLVVRGQLMFPLSGLTTLCWWRLVWIFFCLNKGMKGTAVKEEGAWIFIPKVKTAAWF